MLFLICQSIVQQPKQHSTHTLWCNQCTTTTNQLVIPTNSRQFNGKKEKKWVKPRLFIRFNSLYEVFFSTVQPILRCSCAAATLLVLSCLGQHTLGAASHSMAVAAQPLLQCCWVAVTLPALMLSFIHCGGELFYVHICFVQTNSLILGLLTAKLG